MKKLSPVVPASAWLALVAVQIYVVVFTVRVELSLIQSLAISSTNPATLASEVQAQLLPELLPVLFTSFAIETSVLGVVGFSTYYCLSSLGSVKSLLLSSLKKEDPLAAEAAKAKLDSISLRDPLEMSVVLVGLGLSSQLLSLYSIELGDQYGTIVSLGFLALLIYVLYHVSSSARELYLSSVEFKGSAAEIPERSLAIYVLLSVITAGLFLAYWLYSSVKDVNSLMAS